MIRLFFDPSFAEEHLDLYELIGQSRFQNKFKIYENQRVKKKDILFICSASSKLSEVTNKFQHSVCFEKEGLNFSETYKIESQINLPMNISSKEFDNVLRVLLSQDLAFVRRKIKKQSLKSCKVLEDDFPSDFKVSSTNRRKISQLDQELIDCKTLKDFYQKLVLSVKNFIPKKVDLYSVENIKLTDFEDVCFLDFGSEDYYLGFHQMDMSQTEKNLTLVFFNVIKNIFVQFQDYINRYQKLEKITEQFQSVDDPMVVTDSKVNIIIYNKAFLRLSLTATDLKNISLGQVFKIQEKAYQVSQFTTTPYQIYYFQQDKNLQNSYNDQDLGIISSSIAHELNNPLAAILAALEVLKMDVQDPENLLTIEQMTKGARRCQKLVETFLGFSRSQKEKNKEKFSDIFLRSYELVRSREIENNIKFQYEISPSLGQREFYSSTMVMALYLILNDILISYQRFALISDQKISQIDISIFNEGNDICFLYSPTISLNADLLKSKLLSFLLKEEQFQLEFEDNKIRFSQI